MSRTTHQVQLVRQKGRKPYYRIKIDGKQHYLSTDLRAAYKKAAALLQDRPAEGTPQTVAELAREWLRENPNPWFKEMLTPWLKYVADTALDELSPDCLQRYARHLILRKLSPWTIQKFIRYPLKVCQWGVQQQWLESVPQKAKLPKPVKKPRDVAPEKLAAVLDSVGSNAERILRFIAATGCRPSEAVKLDWADVDLRRGVCVLEKHKTAPKTGRTRTLYLNGDAQTILEGITRRKGSVFLSSRGQPYTASGLRSVLRRRGISSVYALRHTAAQSWLEQGVAMEDVAKLLGHADLRTVQVYAQVRDERARRVARSLTSPWRQQPSRRDTDGPSLASGSSSPTRGKRGGKRRRPSTETAL